MQSRYHISFPFQLPAEWQWAVPWQASGGRQTLMVRFGRSITVRWSRGAKAARQMKHNNDCSNATTAPRTWRKKIGQLILCFFFPFPLRKRDVREKGVIGSEGQMRKGERVGMEISDEKIEALTLTVFLCQFTHYNRDVPCEYYYSTVSQNYTVIRRIQH